MDSAILAIILCNQDNFSLYNSYFNLIVNKNEKYLDAYNKTLLTLGYERIKRKLDKHDGLIDKNAIERELVEIVENRYIDLNDVYNNLANFIKNYLFMDIMENFEFTGENVNFIKTLFIHNYSSVYTEDFCKLLCTKGLSFWESIINHDLCKIMFSHTYLDMDFIKYYIADKNNMKFDVYTKRNFIDTDDCDKIREYKACLRKFQTNFVEILIASNKLSDCNLKSFVKDFVPVMDTLFEDSDTMYPVRNKLENHLKNVNETLYNFIKSIN